MSTLSPPIAAPVARAASLAAGPPVPVSVARGWEECAALGPLIAGHPDSTFFHSAAWARVLSDTYGHTPVCFYRTSAGQPAVLLPAMEVASRWTGRRGVSLPFSDFCGALTQNGGSGQDLFNAAFDYGLQRRWRYFESRGGEFRWPGAAPSLEFYGHFIGLEQGEQALFGGLNAAMRRGVNKAEREGVRVEFSTGLEAVRTFYDLHCGTRRRHGLPPQPWRFFENIARHILQPGHGMIATARLGARALAAAVFCFHRRVALYKFGASDVAFQHVRPNNLLMWESIKRCAGDGFGRLHLGRTSLHNEGLRRFKLGFGAREEIISYYKYGLVERAFVADRDDSEGSHTRVFRRLPLWLLRLAGRAVYPHLS